MKRKLKIRGVLYLIIIIYLVSIIVFNILKYPVKLVDYYGNEHLQVDVLDDLINLKKEEPIFLLSKTKIRNNLKKNPLVKEVVIKKTLKGYLNIYLTENKLLFSKASDDLVVLENGKEIKDSNKYLGLPTLINYTPDKINNKLIKKMSLIDEDIIKKISEIEYSPNKKDKIILDNERFILYMNDGITVYINIVNFEKLNKYNNIYEILDKKGVLYLDSNSKNYIFKEYVNEEEL